MIFGRENVLHEERALLCDNNWLFHLAFLVYATNCLNHLIMKLQARNKLFP